MKICTHRWVDLDGLIAIEILKRFGKEKIPEIETAEIVYWDGNLNTLPQESVVFVDICPKGVTPDPKKRIYVFDHHPHEKHPWIPESKNLWERWHTSVTRVINFLSLNLDDSKIVDLARWAYRSDFENGGFSMSIANVIKEMHLLYSEEEVAGWFSAIIEDHFKTPEKLETEKLQKGMEFFKNQLLKFLSENENSPAKAILQRWLAKTEKAIVDRATLVYQTVVSFSLQGPEKTENWLTKALRGTDEDQRLFQESGKDFGKADKISVGNRVIVIGTSKNPRFNRYCRSDIAKAKMPRPLSNKEDPVVVQFQPQNTGFQIFTNGSGYRLFDVAKAIRVEILKARNQEIPPDWQTLHTEGTLPGTEPLYYQQGTYEVIMWGSLTNPSVRSMDISPETVRRVVIIAVDQQHFPKECQQSKECLRQRCPLYPWMLWRCYKKRQQNRKSFLA